MNKQTSKKKGEVRSPNVNKKGEPKVILQVQQDITADDVLSTMTGVETYIRNLSVDTLIDTKELIEKKSADYGPVATVLDLLGELTGYSRANASLGEVAALTRVLTKLVRYMSLRSKSTINFESLTDTTKDLIGECTRLHAMCTINQPSNNEE